MRCIAAPNRNVHIEVSFVLCIRAKSKFLHRHCFHRGMHRSEGERETVQVHVKRLFFQHFSKDKYN